MTTQTLRFYDKWSRWNSLKFFLSNENANFVFVTRIIILSVVVIEYLGYQQNATTIDILIFKLPIYLKQWAKLRLNGRQTVHNIENNSFKRIIWQRTILHDISTCYLCTWYINIDVGPLLGNFIYTETSVKMLMCIFLFHLSSCFMN